MHHRPHTARHALSATALAVLALANAHAGITATGSTASFPTPFALGPGDTDIGNVGLFVGSGGPGTLGVDGGSLLRSGSLLIGPSAAGNGDGSVVISGTGTRVELVGDGFGNGVINRLGVGEWGRGSLTVSGGAVLDGRANASACVGVNHFCNNFIGNAAGSDGTFTVTGAGSQASFLRGFGVGGLAVFRPPIDGFTFGTPGGVSRARVNVLDGGVLTTDTATIGQGPGGSSPTGSERSFADVLIAGPGSQWRLTGGTLEATVAPGFSTATHRNAWATVTVQDGGAIRVQGTNAQQGFINFGSGTGGRTDALLTGAGSNITFEAQSGVLQVGRNAGATATLEVRSGAHVDNVFYTSVGRDGGFGTLVIDGTGTLYRANGVGAAAVNAGNTGSAVVDVGRGGGNGHVTVSNGARLEVLTTQATQNQSQMSLGRDAASSGTLNITGGGTVLLRSQSFNPGQPNEAWNPFVRVGREGSGTLNITGGGKLLVEGDAVSTPDVTRRTSVFIGGAGDTVNGGRGVATISGAGSELRVSGADAYIGVGHGPLASGQLTMSAGTGASTTILAVGNFGATGVVRLDNAQLALAGQYTGQGGFGAALVVGAGDGAVGSFTATNSTITITNSGANGGGVTIGGSRSLSGGDGAVTLSATSLTMDIPNGSSGMTVGRTGSGLLRLQNGSTVNLGNRLLTVGSQGGSDGTIIATGGSVINAGWVGVGQRFDAAAPGGSTPGGTATMVLNGATLNATDVVIGVNGFLGGTAGAINVTGTVTNYGTFSPGSSPGVFTINGNYVAGAGSRMILEVESDGHGGFVTDEVRFANGATVDLSALAIEFRFLGNTDPNAFQATGAFDIDTFLRQADAGGALQGLAPAAYTDVSFSATSEAYAFQSFTFSAESGAAFTATPVPEPGSWALMAGGLLALLARRRRSR